MKKTKKSIHRKKKRQIRQLKRRHPRFYLINACSIVKDYASEDLERDIEKYRIDIAAVTETFLNDGHKSEDYAIDGFHIFRRDMRGTTARGGVAVYVRESQKAVEYKIPRLPNKLELLWVKIRHKKTSQATFIGTLYHTPLNKQYENELVYKYLQISVERFLKYYRNPRIVLLGDFNKLRNERVERVSGLTERVRKPARRDAKLD